MCSRCSHWAEMCPVASGSRHVGLPSPSAPSLLLVPDTGILCKMRVPRGRILQGPENARCDQRVGGRMMPKCTCTCSSRCWECLSPVCVSVIHKEMLLEANGPFQQHGLRSALPSCILGAGGGPRLVSWPGLSSLHSLPLTLSPPFCKQGLDVAQLTTPPCG